MIHDEVAFPAAMARVGTPVVASTAAVRIGADMASTQPSDAGRCQSNIALVPSIPFVPRGSGASVAPVGDVDEGAAGRAVRENGATRVLPEPPSGRVFRTQRSVRLAEADATGRLRLDAAARILQDVATDDSHDLGTLRARAWVVRRTVIEQTTALRYNERVALATFCSGMGSRWAERRVSMHGERGGRVETVTLWVHLDPESGRPMKLPEEFIEVYAESAGGREVTARQEHVPAVPEDDDVHTMPWWPRVTDLDVLDHVNNAASWEVLEQSIDRAVERGLFTVDRSGPLRAEVEFRDAIGSDVVRSAMPMTVAYCVRDGVLDVTLWSIDGVTAHVTARVHPIAVDDR